MPGERLSMRKIREVLRLRLAGGLSQRAIGRSLGLSQGAVCDYLNRARRAGLSWPLPELLDDEQLERRLFPPPPDVPADPMCPRGGGHSPIGLRCIGICASRT